MKTTITLVSAQQRPVSGTGCAAVRTLVYRLRTLVRWYIATTMAAPNPMHAASNRKGGRL